MCQQIRFSHLPERVQSVVRRPSAAPPRRHYQGRRQVSPPPRSGSSPPVACRTLAPIGGRRRGWREALPSPLPLFALCLSICNDEQRKDKLSTRTEYTTVDQRLLQNKWMSLSIGLMLQAAHINELKLLTSKSILALINLEFIFWLISSCHDHVLFCYDTV
jgi:hypothetical protein